MTDALPTSVARIRWPRHRRHPIVGVNSTSPETPRKRVVDSIEPAGQEQRFAAGVGRQADGGPRQIVEAA